MLLTTYSRDGLVSGQYNIAVISGYGIADRGCGRGNYVINYSAVAEAMPLSRDFSLHDPFDLLDTVVVLQNIVATPAATVINYSLSVSSVIKPFVVV